MIVCPRERREGEGGGGKAAGTGGFIKVEFSLPSILFVATMWARVRLSVNVSGCLDTKMKNENGWGTRGSVATTSPPGMQLRHGRGQACFLR